MAALDFSSARREATGQPVTFRLDGETFSCTTEPAGLAVMELAHAADEDSDTAAGIGALYNFLRAIMVDDAEWQRFRAHAHKHRTSADVLLNIVQGIMPELTGRPTERSSALQDSPSTDTPISKVVSFAQASA